MVVVSAYMMCEEMAAVKENRRSYHSPVRESRARATRERMLRCARELFVSTGYAATSVEDVARCAQVGRRTVYDAFGSKRGLLFALLGELAPREEARFNEELRAAAGDGLRQLELAVEFVAELYGRASDIIEMVQAAGGADPDLASLGEEGERRRLENQRPTVEEWHRNGLLRPGLDVSGACDIFWAMTSAQLYRMLVLQRGWSSGRYRSWLVGQLRHELFA
jgi:AcrR family transcriptional regulator